jgi:adenine-specific DNA-methyltransferase
MSRTTADTEWVGRLRRPTGDCYESQRTGRIADLNNAAVRARVTPPANKRPSDTDRDLTPGRIDQSAHEELIKKLRTAANAVHGAINSSLPESLQDQVAEWCSLHGFDAPAGTHTRNIITRQAVLNVLLKTTLYEWHHRHGDLESLPANTRAALRRAAEYTGKAAFTEYVLDKIAWLADNDLAPVCEARDVLLESGAPDDDIGRLYAELMPSDDRQTLGQFRSPQSVAALMRTWAADGGASVLDPGMGAGVLSNPFHPRWKVSTDPEHVIGIDRPC